MTVPLKTCGARWTKKTEALCPSLNFRAECKTARIQGTRLKNENGHQIVGTLCSSRRSCSTCTNCCACKPQIENKDTSGFTAIDQQDGRRLRRTALLRFNEETLKESAAEKMLDAWEWMEGRQVCVWTENCYIWQYGTHPRVQDQSENCTAL